MANTYYLGSSPLGLFNVYSRPNRSGMATFNGGKSRNVNVFAYNAGKAQSTGFKKGGKNVKSTVSLFSGSSLPKFWPNSGKSGTEDKSVDQPYKGVQRSTLHNNDIYDTSLLNIIEKLSYCRSAQLKPQDFAYLKYLGVYPHNRLMIARRFGSVGVGDNILSKDGFGRPTAVLVSWKPDTEDFLTFNFGEEWEDAGADFTEVLNKIGKDIGIEGLGGGLDKGLNLLPFPGFTESLRRKVLEKLGILEPAQKIGEEGTLLGQTVISTEPLPSGNPNIIKMAKKRKTIDYSTAGSGLKCKISITMICEYEQKFISGIDPTIVFMDLLHNILVFGTSHSDKYQLAAGFTEKVKRWASNAGAIVSEVVEAIKSVFDEIKDELEGLIQTASELLSADPPEDDPDEDDQDIKILEELGGVLDDVIDVFKKSLTTTVGKYKEEIVGIANALSGHASTPWHITLGNPLRPIFCSGDMYTDDVKVTLGPHLAFNDLPINFRVEFTLQNARPLGLQEIMAKFNTGHLRTVNLRHDSKSFNGPISEAPFIAEVETEPDPNIPNEPSTTTGGEANQGVSDQNKPADPNTGQGGSTTTKEGGTDETTNKDPNSNDPAVQTEGQQNTQGDS